jgi:hypothetical protein
MATQPRPSVSTVDAMGAAAIAAGAVMGMVLPETRQERQVRHSAGLLAMLPAAQPVRAVTSPPTPWKPMPGPMRPHSRSQSQP